MSLITMLKNRYNKDGALFRACQAFQLYLPSFNGPELGYHIFRPLKCEIIFFLGWYCNRYVRHHAQIELIGSLSVGFIIKDYFKA